MILYVIHIFFYILFNYLCINVVYLLVVSVAGRISKTTAYEIIPEKIKIAVLITSYKEDDVIVNTALSALEHDYPQNYFDIFLAADHLKKKTLEDLKHLRINLREVYFPVGSKARSLNYLLNNIKDDEYEIAVILDGDNIMLPGFLEQVNAAFHKGYKAVQGHRTAKNINTPVAILDAISEETNNHLFRKSQRALGFSASLIGSGMAFEFRKLKEVYNKSGILSNPACDREVDFELMKAGIEVEYLDSAYVLDEKVSTKIVFQNQRRRWLESQLLHTRMFFSKKEKIQNKTKNYWNKLFINLLPPRTIFFFIFLAIFFTCMIQYFSGINITGLPFMWWMILFAVYVFSNVISIPRRFLNRSALKALLHLPAVLFSFLKAVFTMKLNRKEFVHTPKTFTEPTKSTEA